MSRKTVKEKVEAPVMEEVTETVSTEEAKVPEKIIGVVANCHALNIRKEPSLNGEIVCTVKAGNEVVVETSSEAPDWYYITEKYGFKGYAMAKYVELK